MRKREALRRQRQYIGRLMREVDPGPIREFLERRQAVQRAETRLFHEAEAWRQRLLDGGEEAVVSGGAEIGIDEDVLRRAVGDVRDAPTEPVRKGASRALFRLIHDHLVAGHPIDSH
jgi:ribosome-associated protein